MSTASLPGTVIRAASFRGLSHRARGKLRQDAFALGHRIGPEAEPAEAVMVVCDGVGSFGQSDYAAVLVSRRLAEYRTDGASWTSAFAAADEELSKIAPDRAGSYEDRMATTAVAVAITWHAGKWTGEAAWVGDSTLWWLSDDLEWTLVAGPKDSDGDGEYHSSKVRAMPTGDGSCAVQEFELSGGALFAMTDGVGNPLRWSPKVRGALAEWWRCPPDPFTFAAQVGFAMKTHVDDRTVVGIWPDGKHEDADQESGSRPADLPG